MSPNEYYREALNTVWNIISQNEQIRDMYERLGIYPEISGIPIGNYSSFQDVSPIALPTAQTEVQSQQSTTPQEQQKPKGRTIKVSEIHDGKRVEVEYTILPENEKNIGRKPIQITEQSLAEFGLSKPTESPLPGWKWVIWFGKDGTPKLLQINQKRYTRIWQKQLQT